MAQVGPEMAQDGSKMTPRWPQDAPTMLQDSSKTSHTHSHEFVIVTTLCDIIIVILISIIIMSSSTIGNIVMRLYSRWPFFFVTIPVLHSFA